MPDASTNKNTRGAGQSSNPGQLSKEGKYYFFGIGINQYAHFKDLNNAVKDVQDMAKLLTERYQFDQEHVTLLFDEKATRENIIFQLDQYVEKLEEADSLLIYYSGHGHLNERTERGYWIPTDAKLNRTAQYIGNTLIKNYIEDIPTRHTLLVSDSCFSGALFVRGETRSSLAIDELEQRKSRYAFCSGRHDELVYDGKPGENSPFTGSILRVLERNQAPLNISKIVDEVIDLTRAKYRQLPEGNPLFDTGHEGGQFVFRLRAGVAEAWADCRKEDSIAAYQAFLQLYPDSQHTGEARKSLVFLEEEAAWSQARRKNTLLAYDSYISAFPNGRYTRQALDAMREREEEVDWQKAKDQNTLYAYRNYAWKYPEGKYKKEAEERTQAIIAGQAKGESPSLEKQVIKGPNIAINKTVSVSKKQESKPLLQQNWFRIAAGLLSTLLLIWIVSKFLPDPEPETSAVSGAIQVIQDKENGYFGFQSADGQWLIDPQFNDAKDFFEGLAAVNRDGLWGFIDRKGQEKIPFRYYNAEGFSNGLAWVANKDRKYGYIDTTGKTIIDFIFDSASRFDAAGEAWAVQNGKGFYINREGKCIRECPDGMIDEVSLAGQNYRTIRLNGKIWLAENLNYDIGESSWCYDNDPANCQKYGQLYTWQKAKEACEKLGTGWRLPSDEEWKSLANSFGGYYDSQSSKDAGDPKKSYKALMEGGSSGFAALLGGTRNTDGEFYHLGTNGRYWSGTEKVAQTAWSYYFYSNRDELNRSYDDKAYGFSCRCLKD